MSNSQTPGDIIDMMIESDYSSVSDVLANNHLENEASILASTDYSSDVAETMASAISIGLLLNITANLALQVRNEARHQIIESLEAVSGLLGGVEMEEGSDEIKH